MASDILLTGLPRSGTTLMCHLLNKLPNAVALHEPMRAGQFAHLPVEEVATQVRAFFDGERQRILSEGKATSKASDGAVPSNHLADEEIDGRRRELLTGNEISVDNVDRTDFHLYIKHNAFFSACLPFFARRMECFASVRNPLSVILSWRNASMAVTNGRVPMAERFDPALADALDGEPDVLHRQLILVDYFFRRFTDYLPGCVVKYEDMVATGGRALALINPDAAGLDEPLSSRNTRAIARDEEARRIARLLVESDNACWSFYSRNEVENLFR